MAAWMIVLKILTTLAAWRKQKLPQVVYYHIEERDHTLDVIVSLSNYLHKHEADISLWVVLGGMD